MDSIGKEFMEKTKYRNLEASAQSRGLPQPTLEAGYDFQKPVTKLPSPAGLQLGNTPLIDVINSRRSVRQYSEKPLSLQELSYLLWCTQGVQKAKAGIATLRTVPSAGARHAFETYVLANKMEGLNPGVYRLLALEHKLVEENLDPDIAGQVVAGCLGQGFAGTSAATFIWASHTDRMTWRYGERGYRYLHLDAGHVCQNLYLAAEAIEIGRASCRERV